jgi:hypothetical protein
MNRFIMILAAGAFALLACENKDKKEEDPASKNATTTNATTTAATTTAAPAPTPVTIADGDLSTPADFEEAAETSITKANYKKELASLETDIGKE